MMVSTEYLAVILGMGVVTFLPRWLPLVSLTRRSLPDWLKEGLDLIPVATRCPPIPLAANLR